MSIEIGTINGKPYVKSEFDKYNEQVVLSDLEQEFLSTVINYFKSLNYSTDTIVCQRRTDSYLTVLANNRYGSDFLRIKVTDRTKWFSLDMCFEDIKTFENDSRLSTVTNKNQRHWKIKLEQISDVNNYLDLILHSFISVNKRDY